MARRSWWTGTVTCCFLTTLILCITPVHAKDITYWLSFAKHAFVGESMEMKVCVNDATGPFNLTLDLMNSDANILQNPQTFTLSATDDVQTVHFKIAKPLRTRSDDSLYIRANATGGKSFEGFQRLHVLDRDRLSLFIQTDKRIYTPGQKVRFRALSMNHDLKVTNRTIDISIYDPKFQLVARWHDMSSQDDTGVVEGEMILATEPPLGKWRIRAGFGASYEYKGFDVTENEEPPFDVQLLMDKTYFLSTQEKVNVTVQARHLHDVPVKGTGFLQVTTAYQRALKGWTYIPIVREFELDDKGQAVVELTTEELIELSFNHTYGYLAVRWPEYYTPSSIAAQRRNYSITGVDGKTFQVVAKVTEELTGEDSSDSKTLKFFDTTLGLQFMAPFQPYFKNGLPYRVAVEAMQPGGSERADNPEQYTVEFQLSYQSKVIGSKVVRFSKDGVAEWEYDGQAFPFAGYMYISAKSQNGSARINKLIYRCSSPSDTFLQLSLKSARAKVGQKIKIQAESNKNFGTFTYQVFSSSGMSLTKKMTPSTTGKKQRFEVTVTDDMYPVVDVVVFFEAEDGEVVADRLVLPVEGDAPNELSLKFKRTEMKPGSKAKLNIRGSSGSTVFLLGLDKSVKSNDLTRKSVENKLSEVNQRDVYYKDGQKHYSFFARDSDDVFRDASVGFISDGFVPGKRYSEMIPSNYRTKRQATTTEDPQPDPPRPFDAPRRLKKLLPDTWLWDSVILTESSETVKLVVPDTPSTWVVNAFAVHPEERGLTIAREPVELVATKRLYVALDLPKTVLKGEDMCLSVITMNTQVDVENATLTLAQNSTGFDNILVELQGGSRQLTRQSTEAVVSLGQMQAKERRKSVFCINPKVLGLQPFQVTLKNNDRLADRQVREFKVFPEGVRWSQSYPFLIELKNKKTYTSSVTLDIPSNFEKDSLKVNFQIHGNLLGITGENLRNLHGLPTATGDQNVVNLAPAVYVYRYLNATNGLTKRMERRIKTSLLSAYQTQLKFRRHDETFSEFGNRDSAGSTWTTAAVLKSLVQATGLGSEVFNADRNVIGGCITMLKRQQSRDGSVSESGRAHHPKMTSKSLGLAAFFAISLHEVNNQSNLDLFSYYRTQASDAVRKAIKYLERNIGSLKDDAFDATIVAYALTLTGSSKADDAIRTMDSLITRQGNLKYWAAPMPVKQTRYAWYSNVSPLSIEMTSYALMTYILKGRLSKEIAVFRWLNNQRGPFGGFYTLPDTLVGLEALSKTNALTLGDKFSPIDIEISWVCKSGTEKKAIVTVDRKSVNSLQEVEIPVKGNGYPRSVTVTAKTSRKKRLFAFGQVFLHYNLASTTSNQSFTAVTTVKQNKAKTFRLTTCVRRTTTTTKPSIAVAKIVFPSGFDVDRQGSDFGAAGHVEFLDRKAVLYYASLSTKEECSVLKLKMTKGSVTNHKPVPVRVFDLYAPDDEYTTMYNINQYSTCQVEPNYMDC